MGFMKPADLKWKLSVILARWDGLRARCAGRTEHRFLLYPSAWPFIQCGFPKSAAVIAPGSYLTFRPNRVAGIGHQSAAWITAFNLSRTLGLTFVHRPFTADWEDFLGFGGGELQFSSLEIRGLRRVSLPLFPGEGKMDRTHPLAHIIARESRKGPCLFFTEYDQATFDLSPVGSQLSKKYFIKHPELQSSRSHQGVMQIAFHVRRGDIIGLPEVRSSAKYQRFLPESYYLAMATAITYVFNRTPFRIHVYSDGKPDDFCEMKAIPGAEWHWGLSAQDTFSDLATSDVLIMGRSGFSFLAGLINPGLKVATLPWWHEIPADRLWSTVSLATSCPEDLLQQCVCALKEREEMLIATANQLRA